MSRIESDDERSDDEIWRAVARERTRLCTLLEGLSEKDWGRHSLCSEWRVRDVAAHLVIATRSNVGFILVNLLRSRGSVHGLIRDTAVRHANLVSSEQLLAELRESIDSRFTAVRTTSADRLLDILVHSQDIAVPLGISHEVPPADARVALQRIWRAGGFSVAELSRFRLVATDAAWSSGSGPVIEASAGDLLMLATGRAAFRHLLGPE